MRGLHETELQYWTRRHAEVIELAEKATGDLRDAHIALADSYKRLIDLARAAEADKSAV